VARDPLDDRIDYPTTDLEGYSDNPADTVAVALIVAAIIAFSVYYFYAYSNPPPDLSPAPILRAPDAQPR
jgi:hypothetical protein